MSMTKSIFNHNGIVLTAAEKITKDEKPEKKKNNDLVQIYLAAVPSLQKATADLETIIEKMDDESLKGEVMEWVEQMKDLTVKILTKSIETVKGAGIQPTEEAPADPSAITPEQISGLPVAAKNSREIKW